MEKVGKIPEGAVKTGGWNTITKNEEGEAEMHQNFKWEYPPEEIDEAHFLSQASPVNIRHSRVRTNERKSGLVADIPDVHYGFRRLPNGDLQPIHQPEVMDKWLQIVKSEQPDTIILGGDILDAPQVGKYEMDSLHFVDTLQLSIDGLHKYLARLRADNPNARIINTKGNHCQRFEKYIMRNAQPLFGIKPANMPESFSANSLPFLLRFNELEIEQTTAPYQINEKLITEHGELAVANGSTAHRYLARLAMSMMFHHSHRRESARRVFPDGTALEAFSFGCQADTSGSVPSHGNKIDDKGFVVERYENWNNGAGWVQYTKENFKATAVPIEQQDNYLAEWNGRIYQARKDVIEALKTGK